MEVGDIVVLMHDTVDNFVENFEQYIGQTGEVMYVWHGSADVRFDDGIAWSYMQDKLENTGLNVLESRNA